MVVTLLANRRDMYGLASRYRWILLLLSPRKNSNQDNVTSTIDLLSHVVVRVGIDPQTRYSICTSVPINWREKRKKSQNENNDDTDNTDGGGVVEKLVPKNWFSCVDVELTEQEKNRNNDILPPIILPRRQYIIQMIRVVVV